MTEERRYARLSMNVHFRSPALKWAISSIVLEKFKPTGDGLASATRRIDDGPNSRALSKCSEPAEFQ